MRSPVWWTGLLAMISGEAFNLLAYGYAPTSLVAPVGAIGVLVNGLIATVSATPPRAASLPRSHAGARIAPACSAGPAWPVAWPRDTPPPACRPLAPKSFLAPPD